MILPDLNLLMDYDAVLPTADTDFIRFQGLRWFNPLTGTSRAKWPRARSY